MATEVSESTEKQENSVEEELPQNLVKFDDQSFGDNINEQDIEENDKRLTCSITDVKRRELERDRISIF